MNIYSIILQCIIASNLDKYIAFYITILSPCALMRPVRIHFAFILLK